MTVISLDQQMLECIVVVSRVASNNNMSAAFRAT